MLRIFFIAAQKAALSVTIFIDSLIYAAGSGAHNNRLY